MVPASNLAMPDPERFISRIFEAAADPAGWPSVLDDLGRTVGAVGGGLLTWRSDRWLGWAFSEEMVAGSKPIFDPMLRSAAPVRPV